MLARGRFSEQVSIGEDRWLYRRSINRNRAASSIGCRMASSARAEIEVASLDPVDQIEAERLPLLGITYDQKDDVLEIALDGLDYLIQHPREVWADPSAGEMIGFEVIDGRGVSQIIKLREPLMLRSP